VPACLPLNQGVHTMSEKRVHAVGCRKGYCRDNTCQSMVPGKRSGGYSSSETAMPVNSHWRSQLTVNSYGPCRFDFESLEDIWWWNGGSEDVRKVIIEPIGKVSSLALQQAGCCMVRCPVDAFAGRDWWSPHARVCHGACLVV
jgi:hypothetical protein